MMAAIWWILCALYLHVAYQPLTPDSYAYVAAAESLLESGRLDLPFAPARSTTVPVAFSAWPPGYPLLIALAARTGIDAWLAARLVSAVCLLGVLALGFAWSRSASGSPTAYALALLCGMSVTVATSIWSEGPFLVSLLLILAGLVAWRQPGPRPNGPLFLVCAGLCTALLVRHAGWFVVPMALAMLLQARGRRRQVCAFVAISLSPAVLWFVRNRLEQVPDRGWAVEFASLGRAFGETAAALGKVAIVPWSSSPPVQALCGVAVLALVVYAGWPSRNRAIRIGSEVAFALGLSLLAGTGAARLIEPTLVVSDRLVWPAWLFLSLAAGLRLGDLGLSGRVCTTGLLMLALTQSVGVISLPTREQRRADSIIHFHSPVQPNANQIVVSNEAWRAWRLFGTRGYYLPRTRLRQDLLGLDSISDWAGRRGVEYLVWFDDGLSEPESVRRYGEIGMASTGKEVDGLELVVRGDSYHTYRIQLSAAR